MSTLAQRTFQHPWFLAAYERFVYGPFLSAFALRPVSYRTVYRSLREMAAGAGGTGDVGPGGSDGRPRTGGRIVDLGCGTGWYSRRMSADPHYQGLPVVGLDLSEQAIDVARRKAASRAGAGDPDGSPQFSVGDAGRAAQLLGPGAEEVWICGALHQMGHADRVLQQAGAILDPGGVLLCQTFGRRSARRSVVVRVLEHFGHRVFPIGEVRQMAESAGLRFEAIRVWGIVMLVTMIKPRR